MPPTQAPKPPTNAPAPSRPPQPGSGMYRSASRETPAVAGPPPDAKTAAKEKLADLALNARAMAEEFIDDFRNSDKFFKYKAGVIAGWVVISALTLVLACPSADTGPTNDLMATVKVVQVPTLDRVIPTLLIQNESDDNWGDVRLVLNNVYSTAIPGIPAKGKAVVEMRKFNGSDGKSPPADMHPQLLEIRTSEGTASVDLTQSP